MMGRDQSHRMHQAVPDNKDLPHVPEECSARRHPTRIDIRALLCLLIIGNFNKKLKEKPQNLGQSIYGDRSFNQIKISQN